MSRILVVDDNAALRENLAECLEAEGYVVDVAQDGTVALAAIERGPLPDVVILDFLLPGMSGRELAATIRANPRTAKIRLVLSSGHPGARLAGTAVDAFLPKPFGVKELLTVLKTVGA